MVIDEEDELDRAIEAIVFAFGEAARPVLDAMALLDATEETLPELDRLRGELQRIQDDRDERVRALLASRTTP